MKIKQKKLSTYLSLLAVTALMLGCSANQVSAEEIDYYNRIDLGKSSRMIILDDDSLWAWGYTTQEPYAMPKPVKLLDNVKKVSVGNSSDTTGAVIEYCMAIKNDNSLWVWGNQDYGVFGFLDSKYQKMDSIPKPVKAMDNVKDVIPSFRQSYILKQDGSVWHYGLDFKTYENVAEKLPSDSLVAKYIFSDTPEKAYENQPPTGIHSAYVLKPDGTLWRYTKKLESSGSYDPNSLQLCMNGKTFKEIHEFYNYKLCYQFLDDNGALYAASDESDLMLVAKDVLYHMGDIIVKKDGSVWSWGAEVDEGNVAYPNNTYGELGTGSTEPFYGLNQLFPANSFGSKS